VDGHGVIPGARLIILGRQGAGKGTQCTRLSRHYVVPHISTGDALRAAVKEGSALGVEAKGYMDRGELLPDDVMIGIVHERLYRDDTRTRGYILDGFPRTVAQAEALAAITAEQPIHVVIDLDVTREVVLNRLGARRVCQDCGTIYTATGRERMPWICDVCGGDVVQRADDTEDAINRRLDLYEEQTAPLIGYYDAIDLLDVVDGVGSTDEVLTRMIKVVEARRDGRRRQAV
jgi:adenylate kinase